MKTWQVGFILAVVAVVGILSMASAEEPPMPVFMASPPTVTPRSPTLTIQPGAPTIVRTTWSAPVVAEPPQAAVPTPTFTPVVVALAPQVSFESWRRRLPYGLTRDPVVGFLTDSE